MMLETDDEITPQKRGRTFEKRFASLLRTAGFKTKVNLTHRNYESLDKELDILAISPENVVLFVECKTGRNVDIKTVINDLKGRSDEFKNLLGELKLLSAGKPRSLLVLPDIPTDLKLINKAKRRGIYIWDKQMVAYYSQLVKQLGGYSRFQIYGELEVSIGRSGIIRVPGIKIKVRGDQQTIYNFTLPAELLLQHSYVARRGSGVETHYQRMLNTARTKRIAKTYLLDKEVGKQWFPGSIIVAINEEPYFEKFDTDVDLPHISFGYLQFKNRWDIFTVIDGQHRLYSYVHAIKKDPKLKDAPIDVFAISNLSPAGQAEIFQDINTKQKKISNDLTWDLLGDLPINKKERTKDMDRILSAKVAKELHNEGPLAGLLTIPSDPTSKRKFKFGGLCTDIYRSGMTRDKLPAMISGKRNERMSIKNLLYTRDNSKLIKRLANEINGYLKLTQEKDSKFYDNYVMGSNGSLSLFIRLLGVFIATASIEKLDDQSKRRQLYSTLLDDVVQFFRESYPESQLDSMKIILNSEGGRRRLLSEIIDYLHIRNREYKLLGTYSGLGDDIVLIERELSKRILQIIKVEQIPKSMREEIERKILNRSIPKNPTKKILYYSEGLDLGKLVHGILSNNKIVTPEIKEQIKRDILHKEMGYEAFLQLLKDVLPYRNENAHGRRETAEVRRIRESVETLKHMLET